LSGLGLEKNIYASLFRQAYIIIGWRYRNAMDRRDVCGQRVDCSTLTC